MKPPPRQDLGYSLFELLLVLVIVAVLAIAGVSMLFTNRSSSVRGVMDELEGTLTAAQKLTVATGRDVLLVSKGEWGPVAPQLSLAYGDASLAPGTISDNGATAAETFKVAIQGNGLAREHMYAGVVTVTNTTWWASCQAGSTAITTVAPFAPATSLYSGVLTDTNNLFQGGSVPNQARISGSNKRFTTTFWIGVVAIRGGQPLAGGPMGLLLVGANGAQIYKFYNPGILNGGNGAWRRI